MFGNKTKQGQEKKAKKLTKEDKIGLIFLIIVALVASAVLFNVVYTTLIDEPNTTNTNNYTTNIAEEVETEQDLEAIAYIGNRNTRKFHYPWCYCIELMNEKNKYYFNGTREEIIDKGYKPCQKCFP